MPETMTRNNQEDILSWFFLSHYKNHFCFTYLIINTFAVFLAYLGISWHFAFLRISWHSLPFLAYFSLIGDDSWFILVLVSSVFPNLTCICIHFTHVHEKDYLELKCLPNNTCKEFGNTLEIILSHSELFTHLFLDRFYQST